MSTGTPDNKPGRVDTHRPAFWVTLVRGLFAIILGLALFFQPEKTQPTLVTFMGVFWLMNGIISIRWGITGLRPRKLSLAAGIIGVLAGVGAISRRFVAPGEARAFTIFALGTVILLTGILHVTEGFQRGTEAWRHRQHLATILGVFEIVLGAVLILEPVARARLAFSVAGLWALLVGALLIGDALRMQIQEQREAVAAAETGAEEVGG